MENGKDVSQIAREVMLTEYARAYVLASMLSKPKVHPVVEAVETMLNVLFVGCFLAAFVYLPIKYGQAYGLAGALAAFGVIIFVGFPAHYVLRTAVVTALSNRLSPPKAGGSSSHSRNCPRCGAVV